MVGADSATAAILAAGLAMQLEQVNGVASAKPPLRWLCLDAAAVDDVDFTAAETLAGIAPLLKEHGIRLVVTQVLDDVKAESRYHFRKLFGDDAFFETLDDVWRAYQARASR